jgi:hypothetical protein
MIPLVARAIYIDGPQEKYPHFSHLPNKPHINGCDGFPVVDGKSTKDVKPKNRIKIGKEYFSFPEKLVSRKNPSQKRLLEDLSKVIQNDTSENVKKRRVKTGEEIGKAKYTSAIIRSFASSKKAIISIIYKYAKEENISDDERKLLFKEALSQAPIELDGYHTNYQSAFQGTKYFSKYNKIWNGKGSAKINENTIYILSNQITEYKEDNENYELSFYMVIQIPEDINAVGLRI